MEMWCLRALILWQRSDTQGAEAALHAALELGCRYRFIHSLVTMPPRFDDLLAWYLAAPAAQRPSGAQRDPCRAFAREILARRAGVRTQATPPQSPASSVLREPLSAREIEVLHLVAAGLSDRQIAEKLVVAPGTVKRHLNNLYGKLGVHSRTQALACARTLQLIP
jgi:LuxR family maltose regulon positive regulatory protein